MTADIGTTTPRGTLQTFRGGEDPSLRAYRLAGGYSAWKLVEEMPPQRVVEIIEQAGLTGKGGAGFATHTKMRLMLARSESRKTLVVNGGEHEPGSMKDRLLLQRYPHAVLEGAMLAAHAVGASQVFIAINVTSSEAMAAMERALRELREEVEIDIGGIALEIRTIPDVYVAGDESAILEVLEGRSPLPRKRPPYPTEVGLNGLPTLIQNVETVSHLPFILTAGAQAYRSLGLNGKGVILCTLGSEFQRSGVYEIPAGTPLRQILEEYGGGLRDGVAIKAIQPGGPSAGFLLPADFGIPLDSRALAAHRSALGCAAIRAYAASDCMVREIGRIMQFFADASCGQCPRCRMETRMFDAILKQVLNGKGGWKLLEQIDRLIELARGQGICSLINMPVAPLRTGIEYFEAEFAAHIAGECKLCAASQSSPGGQQALSRH